MSEFSSSDVSPLNSPAAESKDPLRALRVQPPEDQEAWNDFINRYAVGEFHKTKASFKDDQASPPTLDQVVASTQALQVTPDVERPTLLPQTSSSMVTNSSESTAMEERNLSVEKDIPPSERVSPAPASRSTGAKTSNQDPNIPNIPDDRLIERDYAHDEVKPGGATGGSGSSGRQELTRENMGQLSRELEHAEADDEGAGPSRTRRKGARRHRTSQVELMPVPDEPASESEGENPTPVRVSPRPSVASRGSSSRRARTPRESYQPSFGDDMMDQGIFESGTNTTSSVSHTDFHVDQIADRAKIREYYEEHGYLPAPQQPLDATRRRLRVIRRFGLDRPTKQHKKVLSRFTRLAVSIFKSTGAHVSIITREKQLILAEIGLSGAKETPLEVAYCTHTIVGQGECMVIPDSSEDWRFRKNPFAKGQGGPINFYAGAPLRVGMGSKAAIIGSMCIFDEKKRELSEAEKTLLLDLADCAVSELELLYSQKASVDSAKLHQISVDFLRRSLKNRPNEKAGTSRPKRGGTGTGTDESSSKRKEGADHHQSEEDIDIYDEACSEIRAALSAYAVAAVDLSQFHLFYPTYQNSSVAGTSSRGAGTSSYPAQTHGSLSVTSDPQKKPKKTSSAPKSGPKTGSSDPEGFGRQSDPKKAASTYSAADPMAPARTPQVLFIPAKTPIAGSKFKDENLAVLGYSCAHDGFAFNFSSSPVARKIISDFIANNVKTRRVWYTRDDSEGIAQSINHLMPPGTETSLAMPVFDFDGQVSFAVVACWKDPLYTYPAGAMQFVETIAGSLLASVMKGKLYQAERAQLNFASAASHELRTPLHQINAAASLLRGSLHGAFTSDFMMSQPQTSPSSSPRMGRRGSLGMSLDERLEALAQLEIIEANGLTLSQILENIIDTLDIGRSLAKPEVIIGGPESQQSKEITRTWHLGDVLEQVVDDAVELESKTRRISGGKDMNNVEVILEVLPRPRGRWLLASDPGPLSRALSKIIHNSCKFTDKGYIHITVQDTTRQVALPAGYDNSMRLSAVSIDIKDSGKGMTSEFLDGEILRPFSKADPFMPGSGLGLGLAQRVVELLGGRFAINSKIGKGTLVHIEVPLHLLNADNEADQEEIEESSQGSKPMRHSTPVRRDGIYLAGFDSTDPGVRRVGRTLVRQLKLHYCRIVENINFASLLVVSKDSLTDEQVADLAKNARPDVEIIYLDAPHSSSPQVSLLPTPSVAKSEALDYLNTIPTTHLARPLRPSVLRRIFQAPPLKSQTQETYVSDVVGGEDMLIKPSQESADENIMPSPPHSPPLPPRFVHTMSSSGPDSPTWTSPGSSPIAMPSVCLPQPETVPDDDESKEVEGSSTGAKTDEIVRPDLHETASDPLPAVESIGERPAMKEFKSQFQVPDESAGQLKVLVVEDNAVNRKILTTMLKRTSCKFAEAVDGAEAVAVFLSFAPDLVLLDINMPVKDGFQAAAEMRAIESSQARKASRIIAVTALSSEAHRRKGIVECGISEWRTKPVAIKELREEVERMKLS